MGMDTDLSEQDVVDCSYHQFMGGYHNNGCKGGQPTAVFDYYNIKDVVAENQYPYFSGRTQNIGPCRMPNKVNDVIRGNLRVENLRVRNENDMAQYLIQKGSMVVAMAADDAWKAYFQDLGDGIFDYGPAINAQPNHVVVLVGYGSERGKDYWLIKNSWGTNWGMGGYGKIRRGVNMCGIMNAGFWVV